LEHYQQNHSENFGLLITLKQNNKHEYRK
jgi:hypothetical protein